jgi:predicted type IV restriction endonuclease
MLEILQDIRTRLQANEYKNEEHVRLSLVARIVKASGWNIWDPTEVYTEFKATEKEDNTRVDVALFAKNFEADTIFIECKGHGRIGDDLAKVERQLRDYNRNHSALFTIITDGQQWRFYYSLTSGEFAQKLFAKVDLAVDNLSELAEQFQTFLSKEYVLNGKARYAAESYLMLSKKERIMKDVLPEAEKAITLPPYPALPDALMALLAEKNLVITKQEAVAFLAGDKLLAPDNLLLSARVPVSKSSVVKPDLGHGENQQPVFQLFLSRSKVLAKAQWDTEKREKFVVAAGSTASAQVSESLSKGYEAVRKKLLTKKVLEQKDGLLYFNQPHSFDTATQAASIICGYSANGRTAWKDSSGVILGEYTK